MIDPQGYPLQQYTNLIGDIVQEILSDGTIVLITGVTISSGSGSPEGVVVAPVGSFYIDKNGVDPNIWYQKRTGVLDTGWFATGGGGGAGVTSVFGRMGAVVAAFDDYSAVPNLFLGDTNSAISFNSGLGSVSFSDGVGANFVLFGNNNALLTAFVGGTLDLRGHIVNIANVGGAATALINLEGSVSMSPLPPIFANNAAAITGGLVAGNLYRTGADPDTLCIVH
jgi:hypothetical protein